jgi:hypothetical protein
VKTTKNVMGQDASDLKPGNFKGKNFKNGAFLAPNRTADESPSDAPEATQRAVLRDLVHAPGQLPREGRNTRSRTVREQRPDEMYGATEIPGGSEPHVGGDLERKSIDKDTQRPADPRNQHEKQAEKERRGLDREFGRE